MARQFGATWWGEAWVDALENRADLDPNRLPRGRTYARQDRVARIAIEPGRITALVRGSRALPYKVTVAVPVLTDEAWERVVAAIAGRAAHAAALLDGELEPGVLADAHEAGVDLLPGAGDVAPRCSCPDWADPCKHAAAVCYLVADDLDHDPFLLFALRGRTRDALLSQVRERRRTDAAQARGADDAEPDHDLAASQPPVDPGVVARSAWAAERPPYPPRREPPATPGAPASWPSEPPPGAPFTSAGLTEVATDAARRAWHQLTEGAPSCLDLDVDSDLARRAAERSDRDASVLDLARAAGVAGSALAHEAAAWRHAGAQGVSMLHEVLWAPDPALVARGLEAFAEVGVDPEDIRVRSNRLTAGEVQLRVSADGRWWRFERRGRSWELVESPVENPAELLSG
jgi:uncharacterized Zn finger protein